MRMRLLQSGDHTVSSIASKDVDNQIISLVRSDPNFNADNPREITASDVMAWVIKNS